MNTVIVIETYSKYIQIFHRPELNGIKIQTFRHSELRKMRHLKINPHSKKYTETRVSENSYSPIFYAVSRGVNFANKNSNAALKISSIYFAVAEKMLKPLSFSPYNVSINLTIDGLSWKNIRNINLNILKNSNSQITQFLLLCGDTDFAASTNFIIVKSTM